ncbi:MAG: DUF5685 family protein [Clostridia bacterium]|nr:DUF5685 family protein [Clostridia bacterium]
MFGYVVANTKALTAEELKIYKGMYCGLCRTLKKRYGQAGRLTLTYDMTFLILVLSSLYDVDERSGYERCAVHPAKKHFYVVNRFTEYAADMNIALSYNKLMDDWKDDKNLASKTAADILKKDYYSIWDKHPKQCASLEKRLSELAEVEKKGILSPDIPADIFGQLLADLFVIRDDQYTDTLKKSMAALGRFIYIMDAWDDLDEDIKKERYNPLTAMSPSAVEPVLTMLISECAKNLFSLPFKRNEGIIKNIIYSGVWSKYSLKNAKEAKKAAKQTDTLKKD